MYKRSSTEPYEQRMKKLDKITEQIVALQKTCNWDGYLRWKRLSFAEKAEVEREWDAYYAKCRQSVAGQLFQDMKEAFDTKNGARVKELQIVAREMLAGKRYSPKIKEPFYPDHTQSVFRMIEELTERAEKLRGYYSSNTPKPGILPTRDNDPFAEDVADAMGIDVPRNQRQEDVDSFLDF